MTELKKITCTGTLKQKGQETRCNRILAEVEYANDVRLEIKCPKCGTMNIIEAKPKHKPELKLIETVHGIELGSFPIIEIST